MVVTNKNELELVVDHLILEAGNIQDYKLSACYINVGNVLQQALEQLEDDSRHPDLSLQVISLPNQLDQAISECCTTDCYLYRIGHCKYIEKQNCPSIISYLYTE